MLRLYFTLLFTLFLFSAGTQAQLLSRNTNATKGRLINDSTKQAIPYAHLFNESMRMGSISDEKGHFSMLAEPGDTLIIGALGYLSKVVFVTDSMLLGKSLIALKPRIFNIEEVSILAFRDYAHFKDAFLELDLTQTPSKILRNNLYTLSVKEAREGDKETDMRINQLQPNIRLVKGNATLYTRDDIMRMNYKKKLKEESRQRVIDEKYNKEIICNVTNLPFSEIVDFMGFCNFSEDFLFNATPYEIVVELEEKLISYELKKGGGELNINEWDILEILLS